MARKRVIAPEFFTHEVMCELDFATRLAFIGLWGQSDRRGIFKWKPQQLKWALFPADNVDFASMLEKLLEVGQIERFTVDGEDYGWIPTFTKHQTFHQNERINKLLPDPPAELQARYRGSHSPEPPPPEPPPQADTSTVLAPPHGDRSTVLAPPQHSASTTVIGYRLSDIEKTAAVAAVARERARDDDRGGGMSSTESPPTALAIANPSPPRDRPPRRKRGAGLEHVRDLLPEAHHRRAFMAYAEQHRHPGIFAGVIRELIHGREPPGWAGGPTWEPVPAAIVGQALHEMAVAGAPCTEHVLQAFIEPLLRQQSKPPAEEPISGIFPSMAREYARLGDESWITFCRDNGIAWEKAA